MNINGLQKLSLVDFDGHIACTIFTGGCNFACPFCHNSTLVANKEDRIDEDTILDFLKSRNGVLDSVVISGGEPTLNTDLPDFIKKIKALGFLVKLDTNGTNPSLLQYLIDSNLVDYVAMDIKNGQTNYDVTCNAKVNFEFIKQSIKILIRSNIGYEFRTTLVKEFHNTNDIIEIKNLISGADKCYLQKYVPSTSCINSNLTEIDQETAQDFIKILEQSVKEVHLRGY